MQFCPFQIKSEEEIEEEIIFGKNGSENKAEYKKRRLFEEERRRKMQDNKYNKFNKYFYESVRYYFLKDPYGTILDIISIYQNVKNTNTEPLGFLNNIKSKYNLINEQIKFLKVKSGGNDSLFLKLILEEYPPVKIIHSNTKHDWLKIKDNKEQEEKIYELNKFYEKEYNESNVETKFEYFKDYCNVYYKSYIVSHFKSREYLSVIVELNKIREEFRKKGFQFESIFEKKYLIQKIM